MRKFPDGRIEGSGVEARQGYLGRPVLAVLVVSTVLALVALGILWSAVL